MEKSECEIQHFGFSAEQISLERKYIIEKILSNAVEGMLGKLKTSTETAELLAQQKGEVSRRMCKAFEEPLAVLEAMDKKYFSIPKHVRLLQSFENSKQYTEKDEQLSDEEFATMRQLFLENTIMINSLKMENDQYKSIAPLINDELEIHAQLQASFTTIDLTKLIELVDKTKDIAEKK